MKIKHLVGVICSICTITVSTLVGTAFTDVPQTAGYYDAVNRISSLRIMQGDDSGLFRPNAYTTREQFMKVIVKALGKEGEAIKNYSKSDFQDIEEGRWSLPSIQYAYKNGIVSGAGNNTFDPQREVTFEEACTILLRSLKITPPEGQWPYNFIEECNRQDLLKDISLMRTEKVPRWAAAVMIDRLWIKNIIKNPDYDFGNVDSTRFNNDVIVLGNAITHSYLGENQIITNRGTYYANPELIKGLKLGQKYKMFLYNDTVAGKFAERSNEEQYTVENLSGSDLIYLDKTGRQKEIKLPEKSIYYYNGAAITFERAKGLLALNWTVCFAKNDIDSGYEYVALFEPLYSDPRVVSDLNKDTMMFEGINLSQNVKILKDDKIVKNSDIETKDVMYKVTDVNKKNPYVLVLKDRIEGKITDIKPNKLSPRVIQVNSVDHELSDDFNLQRLNGQAGSFKKDSHIIALLGHDGKVVDLYDDTSNYAYVLNYSTSLDQTGTVTRKTQYKVKLLLTEGNTVEYEVINDPSFYKGMLVKFTVQDNGTIKIEASGNYHYEDMKFDKSEKILGDSFYSDNVKVFNYISNNENVDAVVSLLDIDDIASGSIAGDKIKLIEKSGDFQDINLLVLNDVFDANYKVGYIKEEPVYVTSRGELNFYKATYVVNAVEYTFTEEGKKKKAGDAVKVVIRNGAIIQADKVMTVTDEGTNMEAMNSSRVKINGKIYRFAHDKTVYKLDVNNTIKSVTTDEIDINKPIKSVKVFLDKPLENGGRVQMMVIKL